MVSQKQIELLSEYLEGDHPTHNNVDRDTGEITREWNILCPLHDDKKRSASLNVDKGVFYCFVCGGMSVGDLIDRQDEWVPAGIHANNGHPNVNGHAPDKPLRPLTEGMVSGWSSALLSNHGALEWLHDRRGINKESVKRFEIGWDLTQARPVYTIPIRDEEGNIVNIRYYDPDPIDERRKIWSEFGYGSPPRLYPIKLLQDLDDDADIGIIAGEWDTILAIQYGFEAVTRTAGENQWDMGWGHWFAGRRIWICQDADDEGVAGNRKIARALERVAKQIKTVKLPYPLVKKHGKDVTDAILDFGPDRLSDCIENGDVWGEVVVPTDDLETVTVLDTSDPKRVGKPVRVIVTVKGRKEPGYTIPKTVLLTCTQDAGSKCRVCPMKAANGEAKIEVKPDDPSTLGMMDVATSSLNIVITEGYGVPGGKCTKLHVDVEEHQAVEILFTRPALDYVDGADTSEQAARYKNLRITSVGKHDTPPNNTISAVGALHPNPKSQVNEFLVSSLEMMETSVDRFELNDQTISLMRRFQEPRKPLNKLAVINKNLAEHVTRIHGRPEMHALMDLTFHSVLSFKFAGELINRGWLESLIVGDTRTGKSLAAERLIRHFSAGEIISCEAATFAGIVGGVQQLGGKEWAITWGVLPINDKRLVVLDEVGGLEPEEIAQMSDIRSSGQAKLIKVVQETTWARTRLMWLGNPRNSSMAHYTYGVDAIRPLIGNAEDIARFDLAMAVTVDDVPAEVINRPAGTGELIYTAEACHALLMWVWTRKPEQVTFTPAAEEAVFQHANSLGKMYIEDPPLIQGANVRIKIARVAVSLAARTFSTDDSCEIVVVLPSHVEAAVQFINHLYGMKSFGYRERSRERIADRAIAEGNREKIMRYLKGRPILAKFLRTTGKFRRQDLEEIMGDLEKMEANAMIATLYSARMVSKVKGDIIVEPTLHSLLRELNHE